MTFESGAKTQQANNIALSVLNDGSVYETRKHIGFAMLQDSSHRGLTFRNLAENEAKNQRAKFGSKFKAEHISDAARVIQSATIDHCLEVIRDELGNGQIIATCRRWFDKVNGNSYFSVMVYVGDRWFAIPYQYGYGNHWQYVTVDVLVRIGVLPPFPKYENGNTNYGYLSDLPVIFRDVGYLKKRDMFKGLYI